MKKILVLFCIGLMATSAQEVKSVEAKGMGVSRNDALQDALRNAVSQAVGVALSSQTSVENFMVISDAIATNTQGYIKSYTVASEKKNADNYELSVKAEVTTTPLKADFNLLAKGVGGVRFLAMYDSRNVAGSQKSDYDFVLDQINKYFASKKYRYIDRNRFASLQKEALLLMEDHDTSGVSYAQQLALLADAQFLIVVKNIRRETISEQFDTRVKSRVVVDAITLDNCTGEGLGTVSLQGSWQEGGTSTNQPGIASALQSDMDTLLSTFSSYIGGWINNGTPYEIRFYNTGTYRDLRDLRTKLKQDPAFGGDLEIVSASDFTKINCTYKKKADEMADKILDYADEVPTLKDKKLDVKLIYGRQISFAPQGVEVKKTKVATVLKEQEQKNAPSTKVEESATKPEPEPTKATSTAAENSQALANFTIFTEAGEKFWLVVNGSRVNETPAAKVVVERFADDIAKIKILFADGKIKPVDDKLNLFNYHTGDIYKNTYTIKKKKDKYIVRMVSGTVVGKRFKDANGNGTNDYLEEPEPTPPSSIGRPNTEALPEISPLSCTTVMSEADLKASVVQLDDAMPGNMTKLAANIFSHNCVTLAQAKSLIATANFDDDKLKLAKMAYVNCTEKNKFYLLTDQFTFQDTKTKFNEFLISKK